MKNLVRVCQGQQYLANVICKKQQLYILYKVYIYIYFIYFGNIHFLNVYIQRKRSADTNKRTQASEVYRTG